MRLRRAALCAATSALALVLAPGLAGAAPRQNHGLTIQAAPNPVDAGDGVLIWGRLLTSAEAGRTVVLYHHIAGTRRGYSQVGTTTTDSRGVYEFIRQQGVVDTNRSWFVRLAGAPAVHSRTVYERVRALVSLSASSASGYTRQPFTFTGHVTPNHASGRVLLQEQVAGDDWRTIKAGRLGPGSDFTIRFAWRTPGSHVVRAVLPTDRRNLRGVSDEVAVTVEQTQNPTFTINAGSYVISYGQSTTVTGTLYAAGGKTPQPNTAVTLCRRLPYGMARTVCDVAGLTDSQGGYSFTVAPTRNAWYFVKTTLKPRRRTASLFIGVREVVTMSASSTASAVGQTDTFSGTVTPPSQGGEAVLLQRRGEHGDWHTVGYGRVRSDGSYSISHTFRAPGTKVFRTRTRSDRINLGGASDPVTVTVAPAPASSLPSS